MVNNKSFLNDIIHVAESESNTFTWFNSSKYSIGIVNNVNGRRITFCKSLCKELGLKDIVHVLISEKTGTIVIAGVKFSLKASELQLNSSEKKTCYNAEAVKTLTDVFDLDFTTHTSMTFSDITIEHVDDIPIATVVIDSKAYNRFLENAYNAENSDDKLASHVTGNNDDEAVIEETEEENFVFDDEDETIEAFDDEDVQGDEV